jgi:AAA domain
MISSEFLREYFRSTEGPICIGAVRNPKSKLGTGEIDKRITRKPAEVDNFVTQYDKPELECSIYYCTATLKDGSTSRTAADCQQFPSLFADCDDHNHDLQRDRVIELLEAVECPPTLIVNSGHGLQPHWLLSEPSEEPERIIAARKKLQALLASDAVHDAPRYMRLPGSHNSKNGDWLPVEIVGHHPERRYALEVLEDWLDIAQVVIPRKPKPKTNGASDKPFTFFHTATGTDPKRGAAWAHTALEESARALANAAPGERHSTLLKKANRMGTMVARGWIDAFAVRQALFAAAEACGEIKDYGIQHFDTTFADGLTHGTARPHPDLPDDPAEAKRDMPQDPVPAGAAQPQRFKLIPFNEITMRTGAIYLVEDIIPRTGLVVIWGPFKCGKSFWTFDLAMHVALGWEYRGRRVQQGPVVYLALEGGDGFRDRKEAFCQRFLAENNGPVPFYLVTNALNLVKDERDLINCIRQQLEEVRPVAVVIDTLNRSLVGSESDDKDMAAYIRAADAVGEAFGCVVPIVHHCGIEGTRPRGHTSLTGAAAAQLSVKRDAANNIIVEVEWMKDGAEGEVITSRLDVVEIGTNDYGKPTAYGKPITSCVVLPVEPSKIIPTAAESRLSKNQQTMFGILHDTGANGLTIEEWNDRARDAGIGTKRKADFYDLRTKLRSKELIYESTNGRWFVRHEGEKV